MNKYDGKCDFCGRERLIHGQSMCDDCANLDEGLTNDRVF